MNGSEVRGGGAILGRGFGDVGGGGGGGGGSQGTVMRKGLCGTWWSPHLRTRRCSPRSRTT